MRIPLALAGVAALALPLAASFAQHQGHGDHAGHAAPAVGEAIAAAVAAPSRTEKNKLRDQYRHPAETLAFFGVTPTQTVVEYSPSGGWYTEILAPLLKDGGTLYGAQASGKYLDAFKAKLATDAAVYGKVKVVEWPDAAGAIPKGSVDTVLTFRNVHNMVMGGDAEANFKAFYDILKPGGVLGIEDHRLPEGKDTALEQKSGYLKVSTVRRLAEQAGFKFAGSSEINANPKDTADWPKGVWTLPPTLSNGETDKARYLAIGESDRMTLKFIKPQ